MSDHLRKCPLWQGDDLSLGGNCWRDVAAKGDASRSSARRLYFSSQMRSHCAFWKTKAGDCTYYSCFAAQGMLAVRGPGKRWEF